MQYISHRQYKFKDPQQRVGLGAAIACAAYESVSSLRMVEVVCKDPMRPAFGPAAEIYDALSAQVHSGLGFFWSSTLRDTAKRAAMQAAHRWGLAQPTDQMLKTAQEHAEQSPHYTSALAESLTVLMHQDTPT